jgi:hypothetical protein
MFSYWAYILIGNNETGKTSFQRYLVSDLCNKQYNDCLAICQPRSLIRGCLAALKHYPQ